MFDLQRKVKLSFVNWVWIRNSYIVKITSQDTLSLKLLFVLQADISEKMYKE